MPTRIVDKVGYSSTPTKSSSTLGANLRKMSNSATHLLRSLLLSRRTQKKDYFRKYQQIEDAGAQLALNTCIGAIESSVIPTNSFISSILHSLSNSAGIDAEKLSFGIKSNSRKSIEKVAASGSESDSDSDSDSESDEDFGQVSKPHDAKAKEKGKSEQEARKNGLVRSTPVVSHLAESFLDTYTSFKMQNRVSDCWQPQGFSEIESQCSAVIRIGCCLVYNEQPEFELLGHWMTGSIEALSFTTTTLRNVPSENANSLVSLLQSTIEPQSLDSCTERLAQYAAASFRLYDSAKRLKCASLPKIFDAVQVFATLLSTVSLALFELTVTDDPNTKKEVGMLKSCMIDCPITEETAAYLGIQLSLKEIELSNYSVHLENEASAVHASLSHHRRGSKGKRSRASGSGVQLPLDWKKPLMKRALPKELVFENALLSARSCLVLLRAMRI